MRNLTPNDIKRKVLRESGLEQFKPEPKKHRVVRPKIITIPSMPKTPMMKYLEHKYGKPIQDVLTSGSLNVVAKAFNNEVDRSTLSRWIKRFKLRYSENNLPNCQCCVHHNQQCDLGFCNVLFSLELYDLVMLKRKELLG